MGNKKKEHDITGLHRIGTSPCYALDCTVSSMPAGIKDDKNKLLMNLIKPEAIEGLARVLTYGARKYSPDNWISVEEERYDAALMRHHVEMRKGNLYDEESRLLHAEHLFANAMFLLCHTLNKIKLDKK